MAINSLKELNHCHSQLLEYIIIVLKKKDIYHVGIIFRVYVPKGTLNSILRSCFVESDLIII